MAGIRKHGAHRYKLTLQGLAAGTANDTSDLMIYDAYAEGGVTDIGSALVYDQTAEELFEAMFAVGSALTGQATNFSSFALQLARAGAIVNDIRVTFDSAAKTIAIYRVGNMAIASGATVPNAGTATLTLQTGVVLPWTLQPADVLLWTRISSGTGQASPAIGCNITTRQKGA